MNMRTDHASPPRRGKNGFRLSQSALPEMKARLALLNTAISALQHYQGHSDEDTRGYSGDTAHAPGIRPKPFLVARRDASHAEKAS